MGGGAGEDVTPERLRDLAKELDEMLTDLKEAGSLIEEAEIGGAAFSHYGLDMAVAYPSAHAFGVRDAESKHAHVETIQERLRSTAHVWAQAEHDSKAHH